MSVAQPSIRRLFEQVRALEVEAAAHPPRRRGRDRALVVLAAAAIGAACAGTQHAAVARRTASLQLLQPVAHLIDAPVERARPVHVGPHRTRVAPYRAHVAPDRAHVAPHRAHVVRQYTHVVSAPRREAVSDTVPVSDARHAAAPPAAVHVTPQPRPQHQVATVARQPRSQSEVLDARPVQAAPPAPVAIGAVVVASGDEPVLDPVPAP